VRSERFPDGGRLATPSQRLLLRAALLEGEPALDAWREWNRREVVEELDEASDRLVGLLWRNLDAHGIEHHTMAKLKGVYRHTWFKNQSVLRQAGVPIRALREAGIPTLALKGATLCPLYYRDWGVRRMEDFDLLVPPDRAADAMAALRAIGATPSASDAEAGVPLKHSEPFSHPDGWTMDLHWYSLWRSAPDQTIWDHAVPLDVGGEQTLAPGPTHQLLLVCIHGADWDAKSPIRWVADATAVIRAVEVDWDLLVKEAKERLLTVALGSTLEYLRDSVDTPVPEDVLQRLHEAPSPRFERVAFRQTTRPFSPRRTLYSVWERHSRLKRLRPPGPTPPGLLRYYYDVLSAAWEVERPGQFSREAASAALRIASRRLGSPRP
jgi:putative nucleotidyltransferase-like protein